MQKLFIILGLIFILIGIFFPLLAQLRIGKLPGDFVVKREHFTFYFPLATSIILSILLSILFWFFRK